MKMNEIRITADLVIAGAGIPGICTALKSARMGLKTALISNRPYFGGNGSAELMIMIVGASGMQEFNYNARETGIIEELFLENLYKNPEKNRYVWDGILLDKLRAEENLMLFPNTCIDEVQMGEAGSIQSISGLQTTTETRYVFEAPLFVDDTGDGTVGYLAGAEYRYGREARTEFGEEFAPEEADDGVLPSTMVFFAHDVGHPVPYTPPKFAKDLTKTDVLEHRIIPPDMFHQFLWFYELDGNLNQMDRYEDILQHHRELVYGVWDYIKNSGKYPADNYAFSYISPIAGKRESRRLMGDYILTEKDITRQQDFEDAVGHGGWSIDLHALEGFYSKELINQHIYLKGIYQIPYRCGYSANISNLFIEGRCMSVSHVALGSVRTMATLSTIGQANAVAAFLCKKYSISPREVGQKHLQELQQLLLGADQYIAGKQYRDPNNLAASASVSVSSVKPLQNLMQEQIRPLTQSLALSLPLRGKVNGIYLYGQAERDTLLRCNIFRADKPENYNPAKKICSIAATVERTAEIAEIRIPLNLDLLPGHYFIELEQNDDLGMAMSRFSFTGAITAWRKQNSDPTHVDWETGRMKRQEWVVTQGCLCFRVDCEEEIFGAKNLCNGFTRPYVGSNIWHSADKNNQQIVLRWEKPQRISEIKLFFDSNLNRFCRSAETDYTDLFYRMVKDYTVFYKAEDGTTRMLQEVRDNFQRVNELRFETICTDEITISLEDTCGQSFYSVYEVQCF